MRPTRLEAVKELRRILGYSEETEHVIDWMRDAWETSDFLVKRIGRERTYQITNAMEVYLDDMMRDHLVSYDHTSDYANQYLLN